MLLNGALQINKPVGISSAKVVAKIKRILDIKKIGHAGTLDPDATGLLVLLLGNGTRMQDYIMHGSKGYEGYIRIGLQTDSDDITGEVVNKDDKLSFADGVNLEDIAKSLEEKFRGLQQQVPPAVSAVHVDGKRSYKRVRDGEEVVLKPREIEVYDLKLNFESKEKLHYILKCSKGTYVRALARDIGEELSSFACAETIHRTYVEPFSLDSAIDLDAADVDLIKSNLVPMSKLAENLVKAEISKNVYQKLLLGQQMILSSLKFDAGKELNVVLVAKNGKFLGMIERLSSEDSKWKVKFLLPESAI